MSLLLDGTLGVPVTTVTGTLPVANGGTGVATAAPAFSAYASAAQTVTTNTDAKVVFDTETFDTNSNFASSRFTPTVAGYYQLNTIIRFNGTTPSQYVIYFYKNGASLGISFNAVASLGNLMCSASTLVYLNGSTDYMEVYALLTATTPTLGAGSGNPNTNYFSGSMVRSA